MSIRESLDYFLQNYVNSKEQEFKSHPIRQAVNDIKNVAFSFIEDQERYKSDASIGKGRWVDVPWVSILDLNITESTQDGYYVVYLFRSDCKGVYLTLGQGITSVEQKYKVKAPEVLSTRAKHFRSLVNIDDSRVTTKPIDLKPQADLSRKYGPGIIYSLYYSADNLPPEETLISDFQYMMQIYRNLYEIYSFSSAPQQSKSNDSADNFCEEDNTKVKAHLSYERDRGISKKVKEVQGYACQCCGIDFEKKYGKIGASCVDAHHLTPVSQAKGKKVKRDLKKDFAVLCATCHRLIHRLEDTSDIENLKKVFFKK